LIVGGFMTDEENNKVIFEVLQFIDEWSQDHDRQWRQYSIELMEELEERLLK
jgi:hypothetical protein